MDPYPDDPDLRAAAFVAAVEAHIGQKIDGFYRDLLVGIARAFGGPPAPKGDAP